MLMTSNLSETTYGDWIVMEYNEEDYVIKPFHVDNVSSVNNIRVTIAT